jgi:hypothetical protein
VPIAAAYGEGNPDLLLEVSVLNFSSALKVEEAGTLKISHKFCFLHFKDVQCSLRVQYLTDFKIF